MASVAPKEFRSPWTGPQLTSMPLVADHLLSYFAYGINIGSSLPLPGLLEGQGEPDVSISLGQAGALRSGRAVDGRGSWATLEAALLSYAGVGKLLVRGGTTIVVEPTLEVDEHVLPAFVLGPALGVLLHQRGLLVLHASAVAIGGSAVALLGPAGSGKSTLAAALNARGHAFIADDVTAVRLGPDGAVAVPGFPRIKLWPEVAAYLEGEPGAQPRPQPGKSARAVVGAFQQTPLPLTHVYVLLEGPSPELVSGPPQDTILDLVRYSYCRRVARATDPSSHFRQCGTLAREVTLKHLRRQRSLSSLADAARLIERDVANSS